MAEAGSIFSSIVATTTSGTQLATLLNDFKDAVAGGFYTDTGTRPTNLAQAGYWIDLQNDPVWSYKIFDGTNDREIFQLNVSTGAVSFGDTASPLTLTKDSDDTIGAILKLLKKRTTGTQTLDGDTLGEINFVGVESDSTEQISVRIQAVSTDDITASANGGYLTFSTTPDNGSTLTERMRINTDGKVGFGETSPQSRIHVKGSSTTGNIKNTVEEDSATPPTVTLNKRRSTGTKQTQTSDEFGRLDFSGTDEGTAEVTTARIKATATENSQSTQHGTSLAIQTVKTGETALGDRLQIDGAGDVTVPGNFTVTGDLTIDGTSTTVNTATLDVEDVNITVNKNGDDASSEGAGVTVERTGTDGSLVYEDALASKWKAGALGSEVEVADVSSTQTFTNKTITGADIRTPTRSDVKQDTFANLTTYASTATNGQLCFATDVKQMYQVVDNALVSVGGGSGGLDVFFTQDHEVSFLPNATGNNASFLGGGTLDGVFSFITGASAISGDQSLRYTAGASSNNDYAEAEVIDLDLKQRGTDIKVRLMADMSNFANDVTLIIYDKTNGAVLTDALDVLVGGADRNFYEISVFIPESCAQISYGFHVNNGAVNGETFDIDDIEFSTNPFVTKELLENQNLTLNDTNGHGSTNTKIRRFSTTLESSGAGIFEYADSATDGMAITVLKAGIFSIHYTDVFNTAGHFGLSKNSSSLTTNVYDLTAAERLNLSITQQNGRGMGISWEGPLEVGDVIRAHTSGAGDDPLSNRAYFTVQAQAQTEHVITPAKAVVETGRYYTHGLGSTNTRCLYYTTVGEDSSGELVSVVHGDTANGLSITALKECIFSGSASFDTGGGAASEIAFTLNSTGLSTNPDGLPIAQVLSISRGLDSGRQGTSVDGIRLQEGDVVRVQVGTGSVDSLGMMSFKVTSPEAAALAAIPVQQTVYIKDVKTSGVNGGTSVGNTVHTRDINTIEYKGQEVTDSGSGANLGFVSIDSNQLTLGRGLYRFKGMVPVRRSNKTQAFLYNVDNASYDIDGSSLSFSSLDNVEGIAPFYGELELTQTTTFEVRHYIETGISGNGLGNFSGTGINPQAKEVYTTLEITKIK